MAKAVHDGDLGTPLPFDPDFRGPLKRRSCTDVICLLLLIASIVAWCVLGWYAISHGDPNALLVPKDSAGSRCGVDSHVKDRPYLFFFDLTKCLAPTVPFTGCNTTQVCVEKCPDTVYVKDQVGSVEDQKPYCSTYDTNVCPDWFLPSQSFQKRCIPIPSYLNTSNIPANVNIEDIEKAISNIKILSETQEIGQNVVEDIMKSWVAIVIGIALAVIACIIYILILRWIAAVMVWISIAGVVVGLAGAVAVTAVNYKQLLDDEKNANYPEEKSSFKTKKDLWLAGLIISSIVLFIVLLVLIFLRKRIVLAIALIKEASKAVSSVTAVLFFPIFPWIFQIGVVAFALVVALYLATTGTPVYKTRNVNATCAAVATIQDDAVCDSDTFAKGVLGQYPQCADALCKLISMRDDKLYPYLQTFNIFEFFWMVFFVSALGQMILAMVFAQWYWTFKKSTLPFFALTSATYRVFRYHLGTVAFGSLLVAICRMIRVMLEYIDHKLKKYDNELTKAILCCLKCFFWCLEKFIKFINKNAYIMCAIHGKNFCSSAKDAFMLLARNILRVFVLDKVTDFLFFLSKLLVTVGVGAVAYIWFATNLIIDNSGLNYAIVPVIVIMIATYLISTIFFSVYSMAVDTLFLCFLEDSERNDGSREKPYFMTKNLMKILGKKNKIH